MSRAETKGQLGQVHKFSLYFWKSQSLPFWCCFPRFWDMDFFYETSCFHRTEKYAESCNFSSWLQPMGCQFMKNPLPPKSQATVTLGENTPEGITFHVIYTKSFPNVFNTSANLQQNSKLFRCVDYGHWGVNSRKKPLPKNLLLKLLYTNFCDISAMMVDTHSYSTAATWAMIQLWSTC